MAIFNEKTSLVRLPVAIRKYWLQLVAFVLSPLLSVGLEIAFLGVRPFIFHGSIFLLTSALVMWPVTFKDAPIGYWTLACVIWFAVGIVAKIVASSVAGDSASGTCCA